MTHDESADHSAVVPWREPSVPLPERRAAGLRAAARTLARGRPARLARVLTAGPLLGASAIAVLAAATGKALRMATGAGPARENSPGRAVDRSQWPPGAGADVLVTWTSVEIRWTARR